MRRVQDARRGIERRRVRDVDAAVALAQRMEADGADFIDVGAESTRPGSQPLSAAAETARLLPALAAVCESVSIPVSVDTYKASVARRAIDAGAAMVNDVWGCLADGAMARVIAVAGVPAILMHNQSQAQYDDLVPDVIAGLRRIAGIAQAAGVARHNIILDPGIGFGKTDAHNLEILDRATLFHGLGCAVMFGVSRKSFIGRIADVDNPADRVPGTIMATAIALSRGVQMHRVHDVAEARQAIDIWQAIIDSR